MKRFFLILLSILVSTQTLADLNSAPKTHAEQAISSKPQKIIKQTIPKNPNDCTDSASNYCKSENRRIQLATDNNTLNTEYKNVLTVISQINNDANLKKLLLDSQKSWITFRDKTCKFVGALNDFGEINCLIRLTEERTNQLIEYRACLEHDEDKCNYSS